MANTPTEAPADKDPSRIRWEFGILATMYVCYAAFMLCRNTLAASSAAMIQDPALGLDKEKFGRLMSWHSAGAIAGKLVTGVCADRIGGRKLFLITLFLTAATTAAFGMVSYFFLFGLLNFLGQFFKAGGWPAMAKMIGNWYPARNHGRVWSIISTSSRVGTIAAGLIIGALLIWISWRAVFFVTAGVTVVMVVIGYFCLNERPEDAGLPPPETLDETTVAQAHPLDGTSFAQACLAFVAGARVWLICLGLALLTMLMDFIHFIPVYLSETLGIEPGPAAMVGSAFPTGMFLALIASGVFYDRLSKHRLVGVIGGLLALSCLCVLLLWGLPSFSIPSSFRLPAAMALIFVFGFAISPAYYIPMSVFSIAFGGKHSGFLIALIDVFGYSGAFLFNFYGGSIAQDHGWPVFLGLLLTVAVLALVALTAFLYLDYKAEKDVEKMDDPA